MPSGLSNITPLPLRRGVVDSSIQEDETICRPCHFPRSSTSWPIFARSRGRSRRPEPAAGLNPAAFIPIPILDPKRVEKGLLGEGVEALARDFTKYEAKQVGGAGVVIENFTGPYREWLR